MATITPFHAIRYNQARLDSLPRVIAPPYDVISPQEQEQLYDLSPYNIIRLEYGREYPEDSESDNRYTRARSDLDQWLEEGVLVREEEPVFYWYEQEFSWNNRTYKREGLIASLKAEPYGEKKVMPHEETHSKPKEDRYNLLDHCKTNFSPVFGLYPDSEHDVEAHCVQAKNQQALVDFTDVSGQHHRMWTIRDEDLQAKLREKFQDFTVFIADGHHRYETALTYAEDMAEKGYQGYDRILAVLVNLYNPDLLLFPTHRVLQGMGEIDYEAVFSGLSQEFESQNWGDPARLDFEAFRQKLNEAGNEQFTFGFVTPENVYLMWQKDKYGSVEDLDVTLLQEHVLNKQFGLSAEQIKHGDNLFYTKSGEEALHLVAQNQAQASFIMNPPTVDQIITLSRKGSRLPQKATFFYPKLVSGLALHKLD